MMVRAAHPALSSARCIFLRHGAGQMPPACIAITQTPARCWPQAACDLVSLHCAEVLTVKRIPPHTDDDQITSNPVPLLYPVQRPPSSTGMTQISAPTSPLASRSSRDVTTSGEGEV